MMFLLTLLAFAAIATPAAADPASLIIGYFGVAAGSFTAAAIHIAVGFAQVAIANAMARNSAKPKSSGIKTESTTEGERISQSFIVGTYATAGNLNAPRYATDGGSSHPNVFRYSIIDLGDHPVTSLAKLWIDGVQFVPGTHLLGTPDSYNGWTPNPANRDEYVGGGANPYLRLQFFDGTQTTPNQRLLDEFGSHPERPWSSDMVGIGVPYLVMIQEFSQEIWQGGSEVLVELQGIPVYDPRKDSTQPGGSGSQRYNDQSTHTHSENNAVIAYNIFRGIKLKDGTVFGMDVAAEDLPLDFWFDAMNVCDEVVNGKKRYRCGYEIQIEDGEGNGDNPLDVIDELMKGCDGRVCDRGGTWIVRVGPPALPIATISDLDISRDDDQRFAPFKGMAETFNGVRISYPSPAHGWAVHEAPLRVNQSYVDEDGQELIADLQLPAVWSDEQVQRLGKAWLADARRMRIHTMTLGAEYSFLTPLDVIEWNSDENGYINKKFSIENLAIEMRSLSPTMTIRERNPNDYDWEPSDLLPSAAPSQIRRLFPEQPLPGFNIFGVTLVDSSGAPRRPGIQIEWASSIAPITQSIMWQIRRNGQTETVTSGSTTDVEKGSVIHTESLIPDEWYEVRARGRRRNTKWTDWFLVRCPNVRLRNSDLEGGASQLIKDAGLTTPELLPTNPSSGNFVGRLIFNTTDFKLYRWNGNNWTAAVPAVDVSGQLTNAQIADIAAAKLTGQITQTQITDNSISTSKLAAAAITAAKIASNAITSDKIAANSITAVQLAANSVQAVHITSNSIDAGKIVANSLTAGVIAAGAIDTSELAADSVVAGKIKAGALSVLGVAAFGSYIGSDTFNSSTGWRIYANGSADFRGIVISKDMIANESSLTFGTFTHNPSGGFEILKEYFDVTAVNITAWGSADTTYMATAEPDNWNVLADSADASANTVYWGIQAEVVPFTRWSGPHRLYLRLSIVAKNVKEIKPAGGTGSLLIRWKLYKVT